MWEVPNYEKDVDVLGTQYTILTVDENDYKDDLSNAWGCCDQYRKEILLSKEIENSAALVRVLRHELIHAFLFESGLAENSVQPDNWAMNEEMVDWFARMIPKINFAMERCKDLR